MKLTKGTICHYTNNGLTCEVRLTGERDGKLRFRVETPFSEIYWILESQLREATT